MKLKKDSLNDQLMATAAFRYCLGRQSYIVAACLEWLTETWGQFDLNTQQHIVRDTAAALMDGHAGSETCDVPLWRDFLKWSQTRIPEMGLQWAIKSLEYKGKPWPVSLEKEATPQDEERVQTSMILDGDGGHRGNSGAGFTCQLKRVVSSRAYYGSEKTEEREKEKSSHVE